jgi:hypothetical protein
MPNRQLTHRARILRGTSFWAGNLASGFWRGGLAGPEEAAEKVMPTEEKSLTG